MNDKKFEVDDVVIRKGDQELHDPVARGAGIVISVEGDNIAVKWVNSQKTYVYSRDWLEIVYAFNLVDFESDFNYLLRNFYITPDFRNLNRLKSMLDCYYIKNGVVGCNVSVLLVQPETTKITKI